MELQRWKLEEERKLEEARLAEESALATVEKEKAKSRAAIEHAEAAQRIAEIEAQKRRSAELKALKEAEEKNGVLDTLSKSDVRYRKYSIEEIEAATDFFSQKRKVGEGGYGPVFKCYLDHTPVAVKVLRPDAAQGKSQFQQEDLIITPKYLVTFTVGYNQRHNIDAAIKKFSENFTILLFHYDNRASEWDEYEWSKKAIHVSAQKQTKWWYAKRFLHPDIVADYDYIFIWDEDLGVENFNAEEYIKVVKKHGLEISQPGLKPQEGQAWRMTRRIKDREVH